MFKQGKCYILDSSFFFGTQQLPHTTDMTFFTTPEIIDEIKDSINKLRIESLIASNQLIVQQGSEKKREFFFSEIRSFDNLNRLSAADQSIIILALTLKQQDPLRPIVLVSDDYEIQNIAKMFKISFQGIVKKGIKQKRKYRKFCKACNHIVFEEQNECENCGNTSFYMKIR